MTGPNPLQPQPHANTPTIEMQENVPFGLDSPSFPWNIVEVLLEIATEDPIGASARCSKWTITITA